MEQKITYGVLTELSKSWNFALGDKTDRSVSRRTAHGLMNTFKLPNMNAEQAEDIAHAGMVFTAALLLSKNKNSVITGIGILALLIILYWNGKKLPVIPYTELNTISNIHNPSLNL
jgi:hypothetical protein